jgi:hypothetical protein
MSLHADRLHQVVREFLRDLAAKGDTQLMLEGLPEWQARLVAHPERAQAAESLLVALARLLEANAPEALLRQIATLVAAVIGAERAEAELAARRATATKTSEAPTGLPGPGDGAQRAGQLNLRGNKKR